MSKLKQLLHVYYCDPFHNLIRNGYRFTKERTNETFSHYFQNVYEFQKNNDVKHILNLHYYNIPSMNTSLFYGPRNGSIDGLYTHTINLNGPESHDLLSSYVPLETDPFIQERKKLSNTPFPGILAICREKNIRSSHKKDDMIGRILYDKYNVDLLFRE